MKKFYTLLITISILILSATAAYAWDINNAELGMSFTISNNWTETSFDGSLLSFKNTADTSEQIVIDTEQVGYGTEINDQILSACEKEFSNSSISGTLCDAETGRNHYPTVTTINTRHETLTYNGVEYFNYVKEYKATKSGYKTGYGLISAFITIQNDKLYLIQYDLYENDHETMGGKYYNSEIFRLLNSISYDPGTIKITLNGRRIYTDSAPMIMYDRTMVPIRAVAEALGYNVNWDPNQQVVSMFPTSSYMPTLQLQIGNFYLTKNNSENVELDVCPYIFNGRTYLPLRAVSENMNANVSWDGATKTVMITR